MGTDRILFGSDHLSGPNVGGEKSELSAWLDCIRRLPQENPQFTTEDVEKILGINAQRLLNIDGDLHA
jgi:predicted TIM-barrel fold metal-dependent hydrolase